MEDQIFTYKEEIEKIGVESFRIEDLLSALCDANTVLNMCLSSETNAAADFVFDAVWSEIERRAS